MAVAKNPEERTSRFGVIAQPLLARYVAMLYRGAQLLPQTRNTDRMPVWIKRTGSYLAWGRLKKIGVKRTLAIFTMW